MTLHVRQSDRTRALPTQWTPWGAMPATREPAENRRQSDIAAASPKPPRMMVVKPKGANAPRN